LIDGADNGEYQFVIRDLLIIANGMWEERATTYQKITREMRDSFRILYVEANYSWGKIIKGLVFGTFKIKPLGTFSKLNHKFFILTPPPRLPFRNYFRFIGILNQLILRLYIKRVMRKIGMTSPILWTFSHQSDRLIGQFQESLSVYHCVDYWQWLLPKVFLMGSKTAIKRDEILTASQVDFVVSTSRFLQQYLKAFNSKSYYVPNAAEYDLFARARNHSLSIPEDIHNISKPILGFSGTLEAKSDLDLLRRIALESPAWNLVFIGLTENVPDLYKLRNLNNVHFLGLKPLNELPNYLRQFDVCLVPFRKTDELSSISPLKIFEYIAAGRPVVATRYPEIKDLSHVVYLSNSPQDFINNIKRALSEKNNRRRVEQKKFALNNTWQKRATDLIRLVDRYTTCKHSEQIGDCSKKN
jgi:glycosyltransferase involved in cell wall biosynthesis